MNNQTRHIGQDNTKLASVGIGAMSFSNFYGPCDDNQADAILTAALDLGLNHIDTSNVYGMGVSEQRIGSFLAKQGRPASDFFHIATKAGIHRDPDTGARSFNNEAAHLEKELDKSLARMGIDHVDLFYVHRRQPDIPIEEVAGTLGRFVEKGKIKQIGFSEIAPSSLRRAHAVFPVGAVQSEYSLSTRAPEMGLLQACAELGATLVAFSPVGRTLLTDRPLSLMSAQGLDFLKANPRFLSPNYEANISITAGFRAYAADHNVASASLAIAWLLAQGDHILPIPGTRSVTHLNELAAARDLNVTHQMLLEIEAILPVGWAHGDRYSQAQWVGPERYC
jgi:aryl-alcohol dehydrogenase-like predicted oxidoreductase